MLIRSVFATHARLRGESSPTAREIALTSVLVLLALSLGILTAKAEPAAPAATNLTIVGWNVESGGADPVILAGQIAAFDGVDLWGLSEVNGDGDALLYENGAEVGENGDFARVLGTTGGG